MELSSTIIVLVVLCCLRSIDSLKSEKSTFLSKKETLRKIFHDREYDETEMPVQNDTEDSDYPLVVSIGVYLNIYEVNDVKMEFSAEVYLEQMWEDHRLSYRDIPVRKKIQEFIIVPRSAKYSIWEPDIVFMNQKSGQFYTMVVPNRETRIYRNGTVYQSYRMSMTLSCSMDLHSYPLDTQECSLAMISYGLPPEDLLLKWKEHDPYQIIHANLTAARFKTLKVYHGKCEPMWNSSCQVVHVKLRREFGRFILETYFQCILLVIVTFVTLCLNPTAIKTRLSLCVNIIVALITQTFVIKQNSPPSNYSKALDVWTGFCQVMAVGVLFSNLFIFYLQRRETKNEGSSQSSQEGRRDSTGMPIARFWRSDFLRVRNIDWASKIFFPVIFIIFNVWYWHTYLPRDSY